MTRKPTLWRSADAAAATGGRASRAWQAAGVSIDSRRIEAGDLFVALEGPRFDGHDFVAAAFERGASAAVVSRLPDGVGADRPTLLVGDTFAALNDLARAARGRSEARVIAVTGSVGKTGTKDALGLVLSEQGRTATSLGNLNNEFGVPLSLARLPAEADYAVFELGMNRPGELEPLSRMVRPDVAIITTIAPVHTEFFEFVGDIADAKAEVFAGMDGGTAVLSRDNVYFAILAVAAYAAGIEHVVGFGAHPEAKVRAVDSVPRADSSLVTVDIGGRLLEYRIGLPGRHWVTNSLAVLAAVDAVGADIEAAAAALAGFTAPRGRGGRRRVALGAGDFELIDDSYNASPASMRAAFETLGIAEPGPGGRRVAVLGDMLELGANGPMLHAGLRDALVSSGADLVFTVGPNMAHLRDALPKRLCAGHAETAGALAPVVAAAVRPGDVVCVKGSLGMAMSEIIEALLGAEDQPPRAANG